MPKTLTPIVLKEQTAPSTPSTGLVVIYAKSDGIVYAKDDAGTEAALSNVAGGGLSLGEVRAHLVRKAI